MARERVDLYLDLNKKDHVRVLRVVEKLKDKHHFASACRDGIMLVNELRQGKIDLLLKLFPFVADMIRQASPPVAPPAPDNSRIEREIADLKRVIMEQGGMTAPPPNYPMMKQPASAPVAAVTVAQAADASTIADNFLNCF